MLARVMSLPGRVALPGRLARTAGGNSTPSYSTTFPLTENPINEGGIYLRGLAEGLDWTNPQTNGTMATGTQVPHLSPPYDDSVCCINPAVMAFPSNQSSSGVVLNSSGVLKEIELFVHMKISAHSITGYELDILADGRCLLVRWNGALNGFTPLTTASATGTSVANGAAWRMTCVSNVINVFCDTVSTTTALITYDIVANGDGATFQSGQPGFGFFASSDNGTPTGSFGWDSWAAASL